MPSKANDLAKRVYEEVTGLSWDETVKPAELPPAKNGVELINMALGKMACRRAIP
ncbi:hypothetical protein [Ensifer adhaerens]|uniref:hypothetical protein n=1 Tax=Ensifer adhaerens TaxID=106592 RepID=UPI000AB9E62E|nr:hypothetical protein [Ensifer adhaerens]